MKIVACGNINNNSTILQSHSGGTRHYAYSVPSENADEFVRKYNKQNNICSRICAGASVFGALAGLLSSNKFVPSILKSVCGGIAGFLISSFATYKYNEKLMDKYKVTEYKV